MAISAVGGQEDTKTNTSGTTIAPTLPSGATANNLVLFSIQSNDGDCTNPAGVSTAVNVLNATDDDFARIAYKVAAGGETAFTFTAFAGNTKLAGVKEWTGTATSSPLDKTASTGRTTTVTSISSGTTATTAQADELCFAVCAFRQLDGGTHTTTNSFTLLHNLTNASAFTGFSAYLIVSSTGTYETTFGWSVGNSATAWAMIATFKAATGGGSQSLSLPTIASGAAITPPSLAYAVTLPTISSGSALFAPSLAQRVSLPTIGSTVAVNAPTLAQAVSLPTIAATTALNPPALAYAVSLPTISSGSQLSAPTLMQAMNLPTISSGTTLYPPSVTAQGSLSLPTIASTVTLNSPTLAYAMSLPMIGSTASLAAPSIAYQVSLPTLSSGAQVHAPTLALGSVTLSLPTISNTQLFAPAIVLGDLGTLGDLIQTSTRIEAFPYSTRIDDLHRSTRKT